MVQNLLQYELLVLDKHRGHKGQEIIQTFYGQLKYVLELQLPHSEDIGILRKQYYLLGFVEPCITNGKDATREFIMYTRMSMAIFIDIRAIGSVVGHVKRHNEWGIVDRSGGLTQTVFIDPESDEDN